MIENVVTKKQPGIQASDTKGIRFAALPITSRISIHSKERRYREPGENRLVRGSCGAQHSVFHRYFGWGTPFRQSPGSLALYNRNALTDNIRRSESTHGDSRIRRNINLDGKTGEIHTNRHVSTYAPCLFIFLKFGTLMVLFFTRPCGSFPQSTTMSDIKDLKEVPVTESADALVSRLAAQDTTPWYKRPNLRMLYLLFFPTCIGVEMTSGYVELNILLHISAWLTASSLASIRR